MQFSHIQINHINENSDWSGMYLVLEEKEVLLRVPQREGVILGLLMFSHRVKGHLNRMSLGLHFFPGECPLHAHSQFPVAALL